MKKKLIIFLIILLIVLCVIIFTRNSKLSVGDDYRNYSMLLENNDIEKLDANVVLVDNSYRFFTYYYNKIDAKDIQENWDNFARIVVPKYSKDITSEDQIDSYFKKNKDTILAETGIDNLSDFKSLVNKITSDFTNKVSNLKSLEIVDHAIYDSEKKITKTRLRAVYKDDVKITFSMKVHDKKDSQGVFIEYN